MLGELIADVFAFWVGGSVARRAQRRAWRQKAERGVFVGGVRVRTGSHPGLSREWRVGEWSIAEGRLRSEGVDIIVRGRASGSEREARISEVLGGGEDTVIRVLHTASAELEWSVMKRFSAAADRALSVPDIRSGSM